jgi:predicted DNA-binding protein (MmcQ/YjbR family)
VTFPVKGPPTATAAGTVVNTKAWMKPAAYPGRMPHPLMFDDGDPILGRLRALSLALPDAAEKISHGHPAFYTTKVFAYYGGSVKVSGVYERHEQSLLVLAEPEDRLALVEDERCYVPAYLGPSGWVGLDLDQDTDWTEVHELLLESYRLTAGPRRVARLATIHAAD